MSFWSLTSSRTPNAQLFHFPSSLKSVRTELLQQLQNLQGAPSVQMQQVPPAYERVDPEEEDGKNDDKSGTGKKRKAHSSELYDKVD